MNLNALILSFYVHPFFIGVYSIADRIINGGRQVLSICSNIIYPYSVRAIITSTNYLTRFFIPVFGTLILIIFMAVAGVIIYSFDILEIISNKQIAKEAHLLFIILLCTLPIVASNIPFTHYLNSKNKENIVAFIAIATCLVSIISNLILSNKFMHIGTSISVLITETFCTVLLIYKSLSIKSYINNLKIK
jgi:O-antigen/teichoic acid export membrane protein